MFEDFDESWSAELDVKIYRANLTPAIKRLAHQRAMAKLRPKHSEGKDPEYV